MSGNPFRLLGLVLAVALTASGEVPSTWHILEKLLSQEQIVPEPPGAPSIAPVPSGRTFLFDEVLALAPENLLQGAAYVVARNAPPAPGDPTLQEAYTRRVNQELQAVLEYYPLLAKDEADFTRLTDVIASGKQPAPLRRFLLRGCISSATESTALSRYMGEHLADGAPVLQDTLMAMIQSTTEDNELQELAVRLLSALVPDSFRWILAHDKEAVAMEKKTGKPLEIRAVLDAPGTIALERPTSVRIEQQRQRAGALAAILASIAGDERRTQTLRTLAGEESARLNQAYPLPSPQEILPLPPPVPQPLEN